MVDISWLVVWNIFPYIGNKNSNWLVLFRGVETTNQYIYIYLYISYIYISYIYGPGWRPATPPDGILPHMCIYVYIYVYMYICIYLYVYMCICVYVYMYICIYVYMHICKYVHTHEKTHVYIYIYTFRYICIPPAYMHTYIHTYIHTYMPIPTNLRRYIHTTPNPPHRGGGGEAEVPCMIVGFQGGSTPNPRNHPHRGGGLQACTIYIYIYHIYISIVDQLR